MSTALSAFERFKTRVFGTPYKEKKRLSPNICMLLHDWGPWSEPSRINIHSARTDSIIGLLLIQTKRCLRCNLWRTKKRRVDFS